jgi:hypothetical protein
LEIDARPLDALHITALVRLCVVPSEKVPVAVNCTPPAVTETVWLDGDTLIDTSADEVTVTAVELDVIPEKLAETVAVPVARALARPFVSAALLTDRTWALDEVQVADAVTSCVVPSEKVPVAVNCCDCPTAMLEFAGVTDRETRVAGSTVNTAAFEVMRMMSTKDAVMTVLPGLADSARPGDADPEPMAATVGVDELHNTEDVRSCVNPPTSPPVAVYCCVVPSAMVAVSGVTVMDVTATDVSTAVPEMLPNDAVMVVVPLIEGNAFAIPALVTLATAGFEEVQVIEEVRFCTDPFRRVPVAVNPIAVPLAIVGPSGDRAMDTRGDTSTSVVPETAPCVTVIVVEPAFAAVTRPVPSTEATAGSVDRHATDDVTFFVAPFS